MPAPLVNVSHGAISTGSLFSKTYEMLFVIRPPQRRFKWTKKEVNDLWSDILNSFKEDKSKPYFLGTLLLVPYKEPNTMSVIDGQQRITTLSLLLAVLRDRCRAIAETEHRDSVVERLKYRANAIQQLICRLDNDGQPIGDLVVTLQDPDNPTYIKLVKEFKSTNVTLTQKHLLNDAVTTLRDCVEKFVLELPEPTREARLRDLCDYVQTCVNFLPLEVSTESQGYLVFDTTNTRGKSLSASEALKARLAIVASRKDRGLANDLIAIWDYTAEQFENAGLSIDAMRDYLHVIWSAKEGYIAKSSLPTIASKLNDTNKLRQFLKEIDRYCFSYLAVVVPTEKASVAEDLKDLRNLNVQSHGFLTMVHHHARSRFEEAVDIVLSLQIRNISIGRYQANRYQKDWPTWAGLVREGNLDQAFDEIRREMVSDEEFQMSFEKAEIVASGTTRHLLRRLDPISHSKSGVQPMDVEVEHILPKSVVRKLINNKKLTPNARHWIEYLGYDIPKVSREKKKIGQAIGQYLNKLGNQALLNETYNRVAQDRPFVEKMPLYKKQALKLTNSLNDSEEWGPCQIIYRQKELAKKAPQIWAK